MSNAPTSQQAAFVGVPWTEWGTLSEEWQTVPSLAAFQAMAERMQLPVDQVGMAYRMALPGFKVACAWSIWNEHQRGVLLPGLHNCQNFATDFGEDKLRAMVQSFLHRGRPVLLPEVVWFKAVAPEAAAFHFTAVDAGKRIDCATGRPEHQGGQ